MGFVQAIISDSQAPQEPVSTSLMWKDLPNFFLMISRSSLPAISNGALPPASGRLHLIFLVTRPFFRLFLKISIIGHSLNKRGQNFYCTKGNPELFPQAPRTKAPASYGTRGQLFCI